MSRDKHLSVEELADRVGVPKATVYDWNYRRVGPRYIRIGRYARFRLADVVAWEKAREVGDA